MKKITLILLTLVLFGCGGGNNSSLSSTNFKYDLIPKDTTTTAEEGWHPGHQPMQCVCLLPLAIILPGAFWQPNLLPRNNQIVQFRFFWDVNFNFN